MYAILFMPFVISIVNSQIPSVTDLPTLPGSLGNIGSTTQNGPQSGFGSLGLAPLTNIGSGAVGNIVPGNNALGNLGNLPAVGSQNSGQGGVGNLPVSGPQNIGQGQGILGNLPNINGLGAVQGPVMDAVPGLLGTLNSVTNLPNITQGGARAGVGNLPLTGSQNSGQGGVGNLPVSVPQNIGQGQGVLGNLPNINGLGAAQGPLMDAIPGLLGTINSVTNLSNITQGDIIERPCQVFDLYCIRRYFRLNGKCKEVRGPIPEPYYRAQSSLQISRINATFSAFNVLYDGLNGRINEFYINRRTDKLVISIEFRNVTFFSRDVYYRFYRRGREPITTYDYLYLNYQSFITTTIIPKIRDLQLYKSETNIFTNDAVPAFSIGPNAFSNPDPTVQLARITLLSEIQFAIREAQLTEAPFYAATFIQFNICDFKLNVL